MSDTGAADRADAQSAGGVHEPEPRDPQARLHEKGGPRGARRDGAPAPEHRVPDLDKRRTEVMRRLSSPLRRAWIAFKKLLPFLVIVGLAALLYLNAAALNVFLMGLQWVGQLAFAMLYMIVQFGALFWFMSRSKVERIRPEDPKVITFDDYWGQPNLKSLVRQWLGLLADREAFVRMGGRYINGLLLYGEPGTGKTMLAKAMAGEAGVAFISIEGSGFRAMFWGVDVLKMIWFIRKARKLARRYGAAIAYIDEIDAVGMSRGGVMGKGGGMGGGMGPMGGMGMGAGSGSLTRLLYEMDGIGSNTWSEKIRSKLAQLFGLKKPVRNWHVLFMGSTNRPDVLDPALLRPGRFDQLIQVNLPDKSGRREIVQGYLRTLRHDASVDVEAIVANTSKSTPAQIMAALTKDAVRIALFERRDAVTQRDIDKAFLQQWTGIENPIEEMDKEQRRQIAVHEAGHTVALHYLLPDQRIAHVSIVARGQGVMGFTLPLDEVEIYTQPLRRIVRDVMVSMAGDVATRLVFGEAWTGAYGDFQQVRGHLRHLYALGYFGPPVREINPMEPTKQDDRMLIDFWRDMEARTTELLRPHLDEVARLAASLIEHGDLSRDEVLSLLGPNKPAPAEDAPRAPDSPPGDRS
jgi:cell division protease FtsH